MSNPRVQNKVMPVRGWGGVFAILACVVHAIASFLCWSSGEVEPGYLIALFSFPLVYVVVTAVRPEHLYPNSFFMIASASLVTSLLWIIYCRLGDGSLVVVWSWCSLLVAVAFMVFVFWLTGKIIRHDGQNGYADLLKRPLTTIGCFITFFIQVTFFSDICASFS